MKCTLIEYDNAGKTLKTRHVDLEICDAERIPILAIVLPRKWKTKEEALYIPTKELLRQLKLKQKQREAEKQKRKRRRS